MPNKKAVCGDVFLILLLMQRVFRWLEAFVVALLSLIAVTTRKSIMKAVG